MATLNLDIHEFGVTFLQTPLMITKIPNDLDQDVESWRDSTLRDHGISSESLVRSEFIPDTLDLLVGSGRFINVSLLPQTCSFQG